MDAFATAVTIEQATSDLAALSRQFEQEFAQQNQGSLYYPQSLRDGLLGDTKRPLLLLLAAVGFVLLIACANVGNLLLARSLARQQEVAMRLALGAGRRRLVSQILTEGLVLALAGGLAGIVVAWWAAPVLASLVPQATPIPGLDQVGINPRVLLFSLLASIAAAIIFSTVACVALTREGARAALAGQRRVTMTAGARRAASALVSAEVTLAVVLLIGAGLTLRSFANLIAVNPGFNAQGVLTVQIGLPSGRYADPPARRAFYDRAFAALEQLPEVETVGAAVVTPLTGNNWTVPLQRPEHPVPSGQRPPDVGWQQASGGYFRALQIPLRSGRLFDARDTDKSPAVVIISDAIAQRYFAGEDAVGKRVRIGDGDAEVVGVVGDIRRAALNDTPREDMYFPFERQAGNSIGLFIRTTGDPLTAFPAIRSTIRALEPQVVLFETRTLADLAAQSAAVARLAMQLLTGFASRRAVALGGGYLRRDVVQRPATDTGAGDAFGAGRQPRRHRAPGHARGCRPRGRRTRRRCWHRPDRSAHVVRDSLWRPTLGSACAGWRCRLADGDSTGGGLRPGPSSGTARSRANAGVGVAGRVARPSVFEQGGRKYEHLRPYFSRKQARFVGTRLAPRAVARYQ